MTAPALDAVRDSIAAHRRVLDRNDRTARWAARALQRATTPAQRQAYARDLIRAERKVATCRRAIARLEALPIF